MVSALERRWRRSSARSSMRIERPANIRRTSGRFDRMLAQAKPPKSIYYRSFLTKCRAALNWYGGGDSENADDQASQPRDRAHDGSRAARPAGPVRPAEQDAPHRQAPERARDAETRRPTADAARAVGGDPQREWRVARGDCARAGQAGLRHGGDGCSL